MPSRFVEYVRSEADLRAAVRRVVLVETAMFICAVLLLLCLALVVLEVFDPGYRASAVFGALIPAAALGLFAGFLFRSGLVARLERAGRRYTDSVVGMAEGGREPGA